MDGTLHDLNTNYAAQHRPQLANEVLRQMLSALAYLGNMGYVHRDIKPDNIFYTTSPGHRRKHHFRLGDFGLCEFGSVIAAESGGAGDGVIGTRPYLAPELHQDCPIRRPQTHKSDVWALYVTVLWVRYGDGLWESACRGGRDVGSLEVRYRLGAKAVVSENLRGLRFMARPDPSERDTAVTMERRLAAGGVGVVG